LFSFLAGLHSVHFFLFVVCLFFFYFFHFSNHFPSNSLEFSFFFFFFFLFYLGRDVSVRHSAVLFHSSDCHDGCELDDCDHVGERVRLFFFLHLELSCIFFLAVFLIDDCRIRSMMKAYRLWAFVLALISLGALAVHLFVFSIPQWR
jgi:hypothetical protein